MRKRTPKRQKQERFYKQLRATYLSKVTICEVKGCGYPSTEIHHKKGRIGELLTDMQYFLAVCRPHHLYIENHPEWAKENGYSLSRLQTTI